MYEHKNGVKFRKISSDDLNRLLKLKQESWWGTHATCIINFEDQRKWFDSLDDNKTLVMIAEVQCDKIHSDIWTPIGVGIFSNIDWVARSCNLSGSIYPEHRETEWVVKAFHCGLDFGFEMLNMYRIQAEVIEYNIAAQKLEIEHLGFRVEGRRRKAVYKAGVYYDSILLGILHNEWVASISLKEGVMSSRCKNIDHEELAKKLIQARDLGTID